MKRTLPAALAVCLSLAMPLVAAPRKSGKVPAKPSTLPPTSPMIVLPPPPAVTTGDAPKLITSEMSGRDFQFFRTAVQAGRRQVFLVDLLKTKAESEQIRALGSALASTQEQENSQITRLAALKGWPVSTEPTAVQQALGETLEKETGSHFDKAVMDKIVEASQQAVSAYDAASQSKDPEIKLFAEQMLPLAQERLRLVEKMTGAGKAAGQLFRGGLPPKEGGTSKPVPPPITK